MLCDLSALKNQKSLLFTQISSTVDPQEQASLRKLLAPIKVKIRNFHSAEKHRKKRWLFKKLWVHAMPFSLLFFALEHYGNDRHWIPLIKMYH